VTRAAGRGLGEGQDVEELDVEPVGGQTRCLGDPVALLEDQDELFAGVVDDVELVDRGVTGQRLVDLNRDRCVVAFRRRRSRQDLEDRRAQLVSAAPRART
jgi:hypothetical protein